MFQNHFSGCLCPSNTRNLYWENGKIGMTVTQFQNKFIIPFRSFLKSFCTLTWNFNLLTRASNKLLRSLDTKKQIIFWITGFYWITCFDFLRTWQTRPVTYLEIKLSQKLSALCIVQEKIDFYEVIYKQTIFALPSSLDEPYLKKKILQFIREN